MRFMLFIGLLLPSLLTAQNLDTAALRQQATLMARIGSCGSPSFVPDGRKDILFTSNLTGSPQLWRMPLEGGFPEQLTATSDPVNNYAISDNGRLIALTQVPGGGLNEQIYLMAPDGSGLRRITDGSKANNWLMQFTHDSRYLAYSSNKANPAAMDIYLYDIDKGTHRLLVKNKGLGTLLGFTRDGRLALISRLESRGSNNLYTVDVATGNEYILTPHEGPGTFNGQFAPDGKHVYLVSNKGRDLTAFTRMPINPSGEPGAEALLAERADAELASFALNDAGTQALLVWNVGGMHEIAFFDTKTLTAKPGPKLPQDLLGGYGYSKDGKHLALALRGANAPSDIWQLSVETGRYKQLTSSPHVAIDLDKLVRPTLVKFAAWDGLALSGWLYIPKNFKKPGAVVLSYHGGPEGQETPGFRADYQALLAQGIAVFAPNVRGSSGFGKAFVNLDNGALRHNGVKDIQSCVDYLVKEKIGDPKRLGIMGGSYGGYMVMAGVTEYPNLFAAGANLFGIVNFATFFEKSEAWMAAISKVEYGDPDKEKDMLMKLSPIHKIGQVKTPLIVLHGANDTNVPVIEAEQTVNSLKQRGVPVEYVLFPDEGHGWRKTPNRIRANVAITQWFVKYLKP